MPALPPGGAQGGEVFSPVMGMAVAGRPVRVMRGRPEQVEVDAVHGFRSN